MSSRTSVEEYGPTRLPSFHTNQFMPLLEGRASRHIGTAGGLSSVIGTKGLKG